MDANRKKLIQLRTKFEFYKKLDKKLEQVLNAELEIEDWSSEVYSKISRIEIKKVLMTCHFRVSRGITTNGLG